MDVVVNASPLIFLAKLNRLDLLSHLFTKVYTTVTVKREVTSNPDKHPEALLVLEAFKTGKILVLNPKKTLSVTTTVDAGELSVLALAKELNLENVVLDDYKAIQLAKSLSLRPISTIFLLVKAQKARVITKEDCLRNIEQLSLYGYHFSIELYRKIVDLLGE